MKARSHLRRLEEPHLPTVGRMMLNATKAGVDTIVHTAKGNPVYVPAEVEAEREKVCRSGCPYHRASDDRCAHLECGCHLGRDLIGKRKLASQKCPDSPPKWGRWCG